MKLVGATVEARIIATLPKRIIGDKAYDSDGLDRELKEKHQIEMIAPNRRKRGKTQDGRQLRGIYWMSFLLDWMESFTDRR